MICLNKKCKINNDDERMITCWLCLGLIHFKCSGIPGLTAEAITKYEGLHWCCSNCRKIGTDFYRFFQSRKTTFLNIQKEFAELSKRLDDYSKLFDAFPSLRDQNSPTQSSPKRRKSARNINKGNNNPQSPLSTISANKNAGNQNSLNNDNPFPSTSVDIGANLLKDNPPNINNNPEVNHIQNYAEVVKLNHPTEINVNNNSIPHLRVIPPNKKSIFISRFAFETTTADIEGYIKAKLNPDFYSDFVVKKFNYSQPRSITSFKIIASNNIYEILIDYRFWPENTLVREYIYKENQRSANPVHIPSDGLRIPKN